MKIGVISDTHGSLSAWEKTLRLFGGRKVEAIIHAGDILYHGPRNPIPEGYNPAKLAEAINSCEIPIFFARGNCDAEVEQLAIELPVLFPYVFSVFGKTKILAIHGHQLPEGELLKACRRWKVDILITGHTHVPKAEKVQGLFWINPGSPSLPKGENPRPTAGVLDLEAGRFLLLDISSGKELEEWQIS